MRIILLLFVSANFTYAQSVLDFSDRIIPIWPEYAPGETAETVEMRRDIDGVPTAFHPTLTLYRPEEGKSTGAAVVFLPDRGFSFAMQSYEVSAARRVFQRCGMAVFVLSYRDTHEDVKISRLLERPLHDSQRASSQRASLLWKRPLQDSQRAIRYLRAHKDTYGLSTKKIGILGFLGGGQIGAIHMGDTAIAYERVDDVDLQSARPDFAMLIYPWHTYDEKTQKLRPEVKLSSTAAPTFIVHADNGDETSLNAVAIYTRLKQANVSAELHLYQTGGYHHGDRLRSQDGSIIRTWPKQAAEWLKIKGIGQ